MYSYFKIEKENLPFYISLLFLVFPIIYSYQGAYPYYSLFATFVFAIVYIGQLKEDNKYICFIMWSYMLTYILYFSIIYHPMNFCFMFYLGNLITWKYKDKHIGYRSITFLSFSVLILLYTFLSDREVEVKILVFIFFLICMVTFFMQRKFVASEELRKEKEKNNKYINILLREEERNRIGRDLHDTLGHVFVMLNLKTELAQRYLDKNNLEELKKELEEINEISKNSIKEVREIINNLKHRTLVEELEIVEKIFSMSNIEYKINCNFNLETLSKNIEEIVVMLIREAVNNIMKHSKATMSEITFKREDNYIKIFITDNGVGFSEENVELKSMQTRVNSLGGKIIIESKKNPTTIKILLPYRD